MRILVTASSKHGSTDEVADAIAERLGAGGHEVDRIAPEDVESVDAYGAVVVGSAVYILQWIPQAHDFMDRFAEQLEGMPVWAFSVGMNGVPKHAPQDPTRIGPLLTRVEANDVRSFAGRYDPEVLTLRERSVARLAGVVEGDFRDWDAIGAWADSIVEELAAHE
ncbi:flavodoxin domain-containing protein [Actinomyces sp. B33]|uniref:flavodoxin domain-containing protein n=1 Tax=Actinomyces sp. B33 TaxID=2942131 RepID=UPI00233F817E|nr:flavodoxin domain-containing protein [Actinomyces sp. B33]MDC4232999.1 flavodoxin domain-containing protein [Actinomyces sp. B33]